MVGTQNEKIKRFY
jgi:hypothetical protein